MMIKGGKKLNDCWLSSQRPDNWARVDLRLSNHFVFFFYSRDLFSAVTEWAAYMNTYGHAAQIEEIKVQGHLLINGRPKERA